VKISPGGLWEHGEIFTCLGKDKKAILSFGGWLLAAY